MAKAKPKQQAKYTPPKPKKVKSGLSKPKPAPAKPKGVAPTDGWSDLWKYIQQAPNEAFAPPEQGGPLPPPQAEPVDPAYQAFQSQVPGLQGNVYAEYGNPALGTDPNATFLQRYGYQGTQLLHNTGLTEAGDIDPNNPYGQASLLQRSFQQGQRGTTNSMAARGQLYSGATQRSLDEGTFQYQRGTQGLHDQFSSGLHDISQTALAQLSNINTQGINALGAHQTYIHDPTTPKPPVGSIGKATYDQYAPKPAPAAAPKSDGQKVQMARYTPVKTKKAKSKLTPVKKRRRR